jgi:hypothetical protein
MDTNDRHIEWLDTILKGDYQKTILTQFGLICFSGFRKEDLNVKAGFL